MYMSCISLLSCQLCPTFPPAWKECGAVKLQTDWDSSHRFSLSQSEAFLPLSLRHSDIACEHDVIIPTKGECVHVLKALGSWRLVSALETECSVVDRKVGLSLKDLAVASKVRTPFMPYYLLSLFRLK